MSDVARSVLNGWESFYVVVGSSGAALIGLQFVVIVLIADLRAENSGDAIAAFGTPTVMHFASALALSAVMSAPWGGFAGVRGALAVCGLAGIWFVVRALVRARRQQSYKPVLEDWIWHTILPLACYSAIVVAALLTAIHPQGSLFAVATAALGLLFIGIHNAWDTVTWIVLNANPRNQRER